MKRFFLVITGLFPVLFFAQNVAVSGYVLDEYGLFMPGAKITLQPGNIETLSSEYGFYQISNLSSGDYTLTLDFLGYPTTVKEISLAQGHTQVNFDFGGLDAAIQLDSTVVVAASYGQAKALNQQKNNTNITNVISSDQVGRFPDANMGDALKRVPGITMQTDQGEARRIIIRGIAPYLNSVTLNGSRIPSAEGDNREVQMDLIPADMIQSIEVNKTLTPDMDADAIGGSVNLIKRSAPRSQRISVTAGAGYLPIREHGLYTTSFVYGNRLGADKKFGLVLNGSFNDVLYGSDNVEAEWDEDDYGNVFLSEMEQRVYNVRRKRRSIGGAFDYEFNPNHKLMFSAMYNWRDDLENRYGLVMKAGDPLYDANNRILGFEESELARENKGGIGNDDNTSRRLESQIMQNYALNGEHLIGNRVEMDWSVSYARAEEEKPNERTIGFERGDVLFTNNFGSFDRPLFHLANPSEDVPGAYELNELTEADSDTSEDETSFQLNFRIPFKNQNNSIKAGVRGRMKSKVRKNNFFEFEPNNGQLSTMADADLIWFGGENFNPGSQYNPGFFALNTFVGGLDLHNGNLFDAEDAPAEYLVINYDSKENIMAGYVRWDQELSETLNMITGVRIEHTSTDYTGNIVVDEDELVDERMVKNDYLNFLPGLTLNYRPNQMTVFRGAVTTALARPNYYQLSPFVSTIPEDEEILAGNAELDATYSWNVDVMAERYFSNVGLISAGVFYKNMKNFIYNQRTMNYTQERFSNEFSDIPNPLPADADWVLIQPQNGDVVNLFGFEVSVQKQLDFLPGFLKNLGIYANYTFTDSNAKGIFTEDGEERTGIDLPGTAPHMMNASLEYESDKFTARASLNFAGAYLDELGGDEFSDRYYDKQLFVDLNASYKFLPNFRLFAEVNNLTNQPLRYYQGISARTMQIEFYQPRYTFGIKYDLNNKE